MKSYKTKLSNSDVRNVGDTAFEDGEKSGIQKGELAKAINIAKNMLAKGFDLNTISELTGLKEAEIEKL